MLKENWARLPTNVGRWLSRHDKNITRNITFAHNASFSNSFQCISIDFQKKYVMTFFIGNLTGYIFWSNFFFLSRLGTKLGKVIGKKPLSWCRNGDIGDEAPVRFWICCLRGGALLFCEKKFWSSIHPLFHHFLCYFD